MLCLPASPANATPTLNLQATAATEDVIDGLTCDYTVSGPNFEFQEGMIEPCSFQMRTGPGLLSGFVAISTPGYGGTTYPIATPTIGHIDVPQNPGRMAEFFGSVSANDLVTVPSLDVPFKLSADVSLIGSFNACLLPLNWNMYSSCDPAYTDFANVNVDIVGQDVFSFTPVGNFEYTYTESFTGTLAPVPEPASGSLLSVALLCPAFFLLFRRRGPKAASLALKPVE